MISRAIAAMFSGCCLICALACSKGELPRQVPISETLFLSWIDNVSEQDFYLLDNSNTVIVPSRITQIGIGSGVITGKVVDQQVLAMPRIRDGYFIVIPGDGVVVSGLNYENLESECIKLGREPPRLENPTDIRSRSIHDSETY